MAVRSGQIKTFFVKQLPIKKNPEFDEWRECALNLGDKIISIN